MSLNSCNDLNPSRGKFIVFEGIDGAGKSTQRELASQYLTSKGIKHVCTREPGGTPLAEQLRAMLISQQMIPDVELMLMMTARKDHVETVIKPALARGEWVLSDRFVESTYAYQGGGRGYDVRRIRLLHRWAIGDFNADMTFMFMMTATESARRLAQRVAVGARSELDKFESEKAIFFENVRAMYESLINQDLSGRMIFIDATRTIEEVQTYIQSRINKLLESKDSSVNIITEK